MPTVKHFEDLIVWQLARTQCREIAALLATQLWSQDKTLSDQINRASGSVMDNIAEGFDRFTKKDFRHFLVIARGSNAEVRSQLYRALDRRLLQKDRQQQLLSQSISIGIKLTNLITHIHHSEYNTKKPAGGATVQEDDIVYVPSYSSGQLIDTYDLPELFIATFNL